MNQLAVVKNEKPQVKAGTFTQGNAKINRNGKDNTLSGSKARHEKGLELYRAGAVSIGPDGYFRVLGFTVDVEKVSCDCPDYQKYKQPCIHYYAACQFQKSGPKGVNPGPGSTESHKTPSNKPQEARGEAQVTPRVKVRLSALSLAVAILQSHGKPITSKNLFKVAGELETWALWS